MTEKAPYNLSLHMQQKVVINPHQPQHVQAHQRAARIPAPCHSRTRCDWSSGHSRAQLGPSRHRARTKVRAEFQFSHGAYGGGSRRQQTLAIWTFAP